MALSCHTRVYCKGNIEAEGFPIADVSEHLERPDTVVWVDLCSPSHDEMAELADELGLHELAVEDALGDHQRPKLEFFGSHQFMTCHAVRIDDDAGELQKTEIDSFIHPRFFITVRKDDGFPIDRVMQRWDRSGDLAGHGTSFLLYGLLDVVVDGYFDVTQQFDEYYDDVSDDIFSERPIAPQRQHHWFHMRQALVHFHRLVIPMREAVSALMRHEHSIVPEVLYPYYQDVYDHILRVTEATDALRDLVSAIVETNISLRDYRQNQVMKQVTSWAAIIAVPTLITGFYGMNVPYPGFARHSGFLVSSVLMVVISVTLYVMFRKKEWL